MKKENIKKIVLAYSGGLDTSIIIPWLKENYNNPEIIAVAADVGQGDELEGLEEKALKTGASKLIIADLVDEMCDEIIVPSIMMGAKYEKYLLGTAFARPIIGKKLAEIALAEGADAIAHGCTGKGNDQVRFELAIQYFAPGMPVIAYSMDAADALLEQLALDTEREPVSATVTYVPGSSEPFRFTAESVGYAVDTAPVRQAIEASLQALEPGEYVLEPTRLEPDVRRSELEAATVLRARVVQEISADEAMLQNARQAAQMLAGVRIEPGKTLSFNRVVGSRTEEAGYVEAQEPAYGTGISGVGGGVCQVSTALYRAALLAGLGIEERHAAVRPMDGCGMGQEAAVSGQGLDLVVRNDTAYPVFVTARVYVDGDSAFCEVQLIGEALGVRYALESQTLDTQTIDEPVYVRDRESRYATYTDERVPVTSGEPGYTVRVERVTLGEGGEELSRETISEDTYDPVAPAIYVGVTERE